jgi:hypothetical protein
VGLSWTLSEYLSFILKDLEEYNSLLERNQSDEKYTIDHEFKVHIQNSLDETLAVISNEKFLNNRIVESDATNVLSSILSISIQSKEILDGHIDTMKREIRQVENILQHSKGNKIKLIKFSSDDQESPEDIISHHRKLLTLFEQQRMKYKNKQRLTS